MIVLPELHPAAREAKAKFKRFTVMACGRRWWKTSLAVGWAVKKMSERQPGIWTAPTHDIAAVGWEMMLSIARQTPGADISLSDRRIGIGGGSALFRSADSEGGQRGRGYGWAVVDEAAHVKNLQAMWEQELRPALADKRGDALFPSTPKGFGFFYDIFGRNDNEWTGLHYPSWTNPYLDAAELESARKSMPELVYRQEFGAEFVQLAGALFRREYFTVVTTVPKITLAYRFWDLAASEKTSADRSAGVKVGFGEDGMSYIMDCVSGRWEWPKLIKIIKDTAISDGPTVYQAIETTGTQRGLLQLLYNESSLAGLSFSGAESQKDKMVRANPWLARAEQGKVRLVAGEWNKEWLDEVLAFPEGEHDDMVDATSGAFQKIGWWGQPVGTDEKTKPANDNVYPELFNNTKTPEEGGL